MKAFAPNTHLVLQGLADMAKQFEQWSATIAESDGFKSSLNTFKRTDLNLSNY